MRLSSRSFAVLVAVLFLACGAPRAGGPASAPESTAADAPAAARGTGGELTVFAAASLSDAFESIGADFEERNPGVHVRFSFAGSQDLAQGIAQGAPADVFASANQKQMDAAVASGRVARESPRPLVRNRLVIVHPRENRARVTRIPDLARPGLRVVLAAEEVPAGRYALEFLAAAEADPRYGRGFKARVLRNVVSYEESVRSVYAKVALGEADAGVVYASDVRLDDADAVGVVPIPDALNRIATYPIAPLADSRNVAAARAFVAYVLSPEGQRTLQRYNFIPIADGAG